jgi:hypothetical protein
MMRGEEATNEFVKVLKEPWFLRAVEPRVEAWVNDRVNNTHSDCNEYPEGGEQGEEAAPANHTESASDTPTSPVKATAKAIADKISELLVGMSPNKLLNLLGGK